MLKAKEQQNIYLVLSGTILTQNSYQNNRVSTHQHQPSFLPASPLHPALSYYYLSLPYQPKTIFKDMREIILIYSEQHRILVVSVLSSPSLSYVFSITLHKIATPHKSPKNTLSHHHIISKPLATGGAQALSNTDSNTIQYQHHQHYHQNI